MILHTIVSISDSDKHFASAVAEYEKRLGKTMQIVNVKPTKHGSREQIITKETKTLIEKLGSLLRKGDAATTTRLVLLSKEGTLVTTEQFGGLAKPGVSSIYIIGGPYGLDEAQLCEIYPQIRKVSFGHHTMPHGLAKLVLLEQIYRVGMMRAGRSYHY